MTRVVVIGAGMAGIASVIRLREAGFTDVTVHEKGDRIGGTWRDNTYPGVACDVPSHLYSYSFAPNPDWSHWFSPGAEILSYFEDVADRFDVRRHVRLGSEVTRLEWCDGRWELETAAGDHDVADVVIAATGVLHHPQVPEIEGLDTFGGPRFHSARWDHDVELSGRRVGIVGTGSSAVQITGAIVHEVAELRLFQRTAQWVLPMENPPIVEADRERFRHDEDAVRALHDQLARSFSEQFSDVVIDADSPQLLALQSLCEANLESKVLDPDLRERLRPDYRAACKRLIVSPDFYDAIQQPNATLVTERVDRIEPEGVRTADGELHPLDVLVLATGFRVDRFLRPIEVTGRDGVSLDDVWAARPNAYLSVSVPEFPNLFLLNGPNGPVGNFSLIDVAERQLDFVLQLLALLERGEAAEISARAEATERFEAARVEAAHHTVWVTGCRSWYLDDRGVPSAWPWTMARFREVMSAPDLADFDLRSASARAPTP